MTRTTPRVVMGHVKNDESDLRASRPTAGPSAFRALGELRTPAELLRLLARLPSLVAQPRGAGEPILVLPGFGASDNSTAILRSYLRYLGYRPKGWGLGINRGHVQRLVPRIGEAVEKRAAAEGSRVRLVGWSLGGYLAREVARDLPECVEQVITLGSPVIGGPRFTTTAGFYQSSGVDFAKIDRAIEERERTPIRVPITAIYSKSDGVVEWRATIDKRSPDVDHFRVETTHLGLGVSPEVYAIIAARLASATAEPQL